MTPLDEMRARFEAKHEVPEGVKWSDEIGEYFAKDPYDKYEYTEAERQNALWQGYQSAMEDRGEAVAWRHRYVALDGKFATQWTATCDEKLPTALRRHYPDGVYDVEIEPLYTAPQPAPDQLSEGTAQKEYDELMDGLEEPDPIERLRFFCSLCMAPQDWLDVEKFFDDVITERSDQWNAAIEAAAKRLMEVQIVPESTSKEMANSFVRALHLNALQILALRKGA